MSNKNMKKFMAGAMAIIAACTLSGCMARINRNSGGNNVNTDSQSVVDRATQTTVDKYEGILQAARGLTADGQYKASNKQLDTMAVTNLNKTGFSAIKESVDELRGKNETGIENAKKVTPKATGQNTTQKAVSDFVKYAGTYQFIDGGADRHLSSLTIDNNGDVVQYQTTGSTRYGKATLMAGNTPNLLSYSVSLIDPATNYYPLKTIQKSDAIISVTWSSGDSATYYGYTSWNGDTCLTNNVPTSYGVDEVWVHWN